MTNPIYPCLWFDGQAKEAATFYCSIFENSRITSDNAMVANFEIGGFKVMGLNGGPAYSINPAISLFYTTTDGDELQVIWNKLIEGGSALMPLDKYPWSEKYGWVKDKFGLTWQLMIGSLPDGSLKINPSLLFVNQQFGNAESAINLYTSIFPDSKIHPLQRYGPDSPQPEGYLQFGHFELNHDLFSAMDGSGNHDFDFNEGLSFVVNCDTQEEIDHYWYKLTEGGTEGRCGWLKDPFGVSWQIVPSVLSKLMSDPNKAPKAVGAFMKMNKFDIQELIDAAES